MAIEKAPSGKQQALPQEPPAAGSLDEFYQTPEGQVAKRMLDFILKGDKESARREYEAGQERFGWTPDRPQQSAPRRPLNLGPPMTLPPEAR